MTEPAEFRATGATFVEADVVREKLGRGDRAARVGFAALGLVVAIGVMSALILGVALLAFAVFTHTLPGDPL